MHYTIHIEAVELKCSFVPSSRKCSLVIDDSVKWHSREPRQTFINIYTRQCQYVRHCSDNDITLPDSKVVDAACSAPEIDRND